MSSDLTEDERHEIFLIQAKFGYDYNRARAYFESQKQLRQIPKPKEPEPEVETEESEPEEEVDSQLPSEEQKQQWLKEEEEEEIREKKKEVLEKLSEQIEETAKNEAQELQEIQILKKRLIEETQLNQFWQTVLAVPEWESILRDYFNTLRAMLNGMCAETVLTVTVKDGTINFSKMFYNKDGKVVSTEFNLLKRSDVNA